MTTTDPPLLTARTIRLEPLAQRHVSGLAVAAAEDRALYRWSTVPDGLEEAAAYVETALSWQTAGHAVPFAVVRAADDRVIGSTRFFDLETWAWPAIHPRATRSAPDVCEIGYTWLARSAIRTAANTEAKLLLLTHAFETWNVLRVCLHTDARNDRSRTAIARLGATFEGILRAHRVAHDLTPRDSARFSITAPEWPPVRERLTRLLGSPGASR